MVRTPEPTFKGAGMNDSQASSGALESKEDVIAWVRRMADEVHDPCSLAIGLNVGIAEMGLIRHLSVEQGAAGWDVSLQLRLTSPGCQYYYYFQHSLEDRIQGHPSIGKLEILWDQVLDWTPEDFAASAREKIEARQRRLRQVSTEV
jgi:metal-sulfur cluster biosynthetic enzyme